MRKSQIGIAASGKKIARPLVRLFQRYIPYAAPPHELIDGFAVQAAELSNGSLDVTWPSLANARWISLDKPQKLHGIVARPGWGGRGNWLVLCHGVMRSSRLVIEIDNRLHGNIIVIGEGGRFNGRLHVQGSDGRIMLAGTMDWPCEIEARLSSDANTLLWGKGATSNGVRIVIEGVGRSVVVGDDCMFARNTHVMTSDLHGISDAATGEWLNPPADVRLARHVWVGQDAIIMKGAKIGSGAIIGARSLVNRDVPSATIVAGSPARRIKSGVSWTRERAPGPFCNIGDGTDEAKDSAETDISCS